MTGVFAVAPALPLHTAGPYVAAAYIVFVALILIYIAIMARKQRRTERELAQLRRDLHLPDQVPQADERAPEGHPQSELPQERIA